MAPNHQILTHLLTFFCIFGTLWFLWWWNHMLGLIHWWCQCSADCGFWAAKDCLLTFLCIFRTILWKFSLPSLGVQLSLVLMCVFVLDWWEIVDQGLERWVIKALLHLRTPHFLFTLDESLWICCKIIEVLVLFSCPRSSIWQNSKRHHESLLYWQEYHQWPFPTLAIPNTACWWFHWLET